MYLLAISDSIIINTQRYGYRDPNGQFRSILSYSCKKNQCDDYDSNGPCTRLPFFSNPNLKWNGQPMGYDAGSIIGETNNARRINERAEYVASLYTTPEEPQIPEITSFGPTTKPSSAPSKSTNPPSPRPTRRRRRVSSSYLELELVELIHTYTFFIIPFAFSPKQGKQDCGKEQDLQIHLRTLRLHQHRLLQCLLESRQWTSSQAVREFESIYLLNSI